MAAMRVLIGEDEQTTLKMAKRRLEHEGYEVVTAQDGEEVIRQVRAAAPIYLILLDVGMPRANGYDVCRRLKRDPATAHIPVIVMTSTEDSADALADKCVEAGADDWLLKPFRTADLMVKVHRVLSKGGKTDG